MSDNNRVLWTEGMFLRPQHFQQHDRYIESLVQGLSQGIRAYAWGYSRLKLDRASLAIGKLGLSECCGVFQDGTPFNLPHDNDLPLPLDVPEDEKASVVYLALPLRRPDSTEVDSESYPDSMARYRLAERQVRDHNSGADGRYDVQIGALKPRLIARNVQAMFAWVSHVLSKCVPIKPLFLTNTTFLRLYIAPVPDY